MNAEQFGGFLFVAVALFEGGDERGFFPVGKIEGLGVGHQLAQRRPCLLYTSRCV